MNDRLQDPEDMVYADAVEDNQNSIANMKLVTGTI